MGKLNLNRTKDNGFTLIELLVTIAIVVIVVGFAVPSFMQMIASNRTSTYANELVASLSFARSEAVKSGEAVTLQNSGAAGAWHSGWVVFSDLNRNGVEEVGETRLKVYQQLPASLRLTTGAIFQNSVTFLPTGLKLGGVGDTFMLCDVNGNDPVAREIILNGVGRVYTRAGANVCP